ncbi:MAG: DNA alkylation repair protein, partial [Bacteroidia bacterium]|nr:DNA alkylation repair protein [Bacteroidia bacterium]
CHMCAMEIIEKELRRSYDKADIAFIEELIVTNSWWDSVDFIAKNILGKYLATYPDQTKTTVERFSRSSNLWLNRSSIIYQLGYKQNTDAKILFRQCERFRHSDEFFIQKAIGWALREYAKTDPKAVMDFVKSTQLKPLSQREAIRNIC